MIPSTTRFVPFQPHAPFGQFVVYDAMTMQTLDSNGPITFNGANGFATRSEAQEAAVEWERLTFAMTRWLSPAANTTPLPITV